MSVILSLPVGGIILRLLWQALTICCISTAFAYGFHLLPIRLQKASFYSVKDGLSKDKKAYLEG